MYMDYKTAKLFPYNFKFWRQNTFNLFLKLYKKKVQKGELFSVKNKKIILKHWNYSLCFSRHVPESLFSSFFVKFNNMLTKRRRKYWVIT